MSLKIIWSLASKEEYADILGYVEDNFSIDAALKLLDKTDAVIDGIATFPTMFPTSTIRKGIRKAVITKHLSVFYRFNKMEVHLFQLLSKY